MTFRIAAEVVDIRPNGNLVIEARREIRNNEEVWMQSLTGVVRRQSIGPDRTVRSDEVAELRIDKREKRLHQRRYTPRLVYCGGTTGGSRSSRSVSTAMTVARADAISERSRVSGCESQTQ